MNIVVQVFAREPVPGQCKTRLIPSLGPEGAAALYRRMLCATLDAALNCGADAVEVWGVSVPEDGVLATLCARRSMALYPQQGADLGARMFYALQSAAARGCRSVLVGTDCPAQNAIMLAEAVATLRTYRGWIVRPALDGGYVCVATGAPTAALFSTTKWGTSVVMQETRRRMVEAGLGWLELGPLADIDEPEDLCWVPEGWL